MEIVHNLNEPSVAGPLGLTIGNFDGVHVGHRDLLNKVKADCKEKGRSFCVMTFVPHPVLILSPRERFLINSYEERRELLESVGVEVLCEVPFGRDFSTMDPEDFLEKIVFGSGKVKKLFLGHDFAFGANKKGDLEFAKEYCERSGREFQIMQAFVDAGRAVSSTAIRQCLEKGQMEEVKNMLSREFFLSGRVIKGEGRGRKIGWPTANVCPPLDRAVPGRGVYITKTVLGGKEFPSVTNVGKNPTFNDKDVLNVETHLLNFDANIYGDEIRVFFIKKIRDEAKFSSVEALVERIGKDVEEAKVFFRL